MTENSLQDNEVILQAALNTANRRIEQLEQTLESLFMEVIQS